VRVRFVLDGEGRRQEVRDHFDRLVLSFEYLDGRLVAARDADGRRVRLASLRLQVLAHAGHTRADAEDDPPYERTIQNREPSLVSFRRFRHFGKLLNGGSPCGHSPYD